VSFTNENFLGFIDELEDKVEAVNQLGQDIDYETEPYSQEQIQQLAELAERFQIIGNGATLWLDRWQGFCHGRYLVRQK
jgi:hypothetical protein